MPKFALPELIDAGNPDALDLLEVEDNNWDNPEKAKKHILMALDKVIGFKEARQTNDIKTMANLYRKDVIGYKTKNRKKFQNGQSGFFYEVGQLSGLMASPKDFLSKRTSGASLLRFALPQLMNADNPDALHPYEIETHYWTKPENAKHCVLKTLDTVPGFKEAREKNNVKTMVDLYCQYVIGYKAQNKKKFPNGQMGFFCEVGRLKSITCYRQKYLNNHSGPWALLKFALPQIIDPQNPHALNPLKIRSAIITARRKERHKRHRCGTC